MIKVNSKIAMFFAEKIHRAPKKVAYCVSTIPLEEKDKLFKFIIESLEDPVFFLFKKGSSKFSNKIYLIERNEVYDVIDDGEIFSLDTLDFLKIGKCAGQYNGAYIEGYDVDASGKFLKILYEISKEFRHLKDETNLPPMV